MSESFADYVARRMAEAAKRGNPFGSADRPVPVEAEKPELPRECFRAMRRNHGLAKFGPLALALALLVSPASAHEPGEPYASWYESLSRPGGGSCCSLSDGRTTEVRVVGDHYEAWIDQRFPDGDGIGWVTVKPEAVLQRVDNPTGEPVVFWRKTMGVLCLVRPMET